MRLRKVFAAVLTAGACILLVFNYASSKPTNQTTDLSSLSDSDMKNLTISLERSPCYGTCPAYGLKIHGDGKIEYNGKQHVKVIGSREGRIDPAAVKALAAEFAKADFLSTSDEYSGETCKCRRCTDFPSAVVEISVGTISHRVNHYHGCACAPKPLFELEGAIDKATRSSQWTGDTSQAGPFGTTCFGR